MLVAPGPVDTVIDVSVVIPTFRREREVLQAVSSALSQEAVSVEVLVLDDSPEGSAQTGVAGIKDARVCYLKRPVPSGGKPAIVRNEGARAARGRYVHFLDDDDQLLPGSLRALVSALDADHSVGVAIGRVVPFGSDEEALRVNRIWSEAAAQRAARTARRRWLAAASLLFKAAMLINSACLIRREHIEAVGGYDPSIPTYEDLEFYSRAIIKFGHLFVDYPVLYRRTGASSLSHDLPDSGPINECYRTMYERFRDEYGLFQVSVLRFLAKVPALL